MAEQSFSSHAKWRPAFHFVASPIALFALGYAANSFRDAISVASAAHLALAVTAVLALFLGRTQAMTVQDRVIRLEERMRLKEVLPAEMQDKILTFTTDQLIGMRFESDADLPDLARRVLAGEFPNQKAIKAAVKNWRPDHQRT